MIIQPNNGVRSPYLLFLTLFIALSTTSIANGTITAYETWFPPEIEATVVSDNMNTNGIHLQVWEIRSNQKSTVTSRYYKNLWNHYAAKIRYQNKQWDVVGFIQNNWVATLQILPDKLDTFGYLSISEYPIAKPILTNKYAIKLPPASDRSAEVSAIDGPHHSQTTVFRNKQTITNNLAYFRATYVENGWIEDETPNSNSAKILLLRKASEQLTVTMEHNGDSTEGVAVLVTQ